MTKNIDHFESLELQGSEDGVFRNNERVTTDHELMLKRLRTWGFVLLGSAAFPIIYSGFLGTPWMILLLIVSLACFFFRTASMFIVIAVALVWIAIYSISSLEIDRVLFSLLLIYLTFRVFKHYRRYRDVETKFIKFTTNEINSDAVSAVQAARRFPWIGSLLSCLSIVGLISVIFIITIITLRTGSDSSYPDFYEFLYALVVNLGALGLAFSLSSLISNYRLKALSIIGLVLGCLAVFFEFALRIL